MAAAISRAPRTTAQVAMIGEQDDERHVRPDTSRDAGEEPAAAGEKSDQSCPPPRRAATPVVSDIAPSRMA